MKISAKKSLANISSTNILYE